MNFWLLLFILLSSIGFYNPFAIFSDSMQKLVFYLAFVVGAAYSFVYGKSLSKLNFPRLPFFLLLGGMTFSIFMASTFHAQSLKTSVVATLPYLLSYSCFIVFLKLDVDREKIMKALIVISFVSGAVYFINLTGAPFFSFGKPMEEKDLSRGIVRIAIVFIELFPLLLFYSINKWFETKKKIWLLYGAYTMILIFLSVIRQIILLSALLGLFYLLANVSLSKKIVITGVVILLGALILPHIPIYKTMMELSEKQAEKNEDKDDVRVQAWEYYTIENQTNAITPILGNGVPAMGKSKWGIAFDQETEDNGCFAGDVGWAGFFFYFGAITTGALLWLLIRSATVRKDRKIKYTTYWLVFLICTSVASGPILYYYQVVCVTLVLYLVWKKSDEPIPEQTEAPHPSLPQAQRGYPQLISKIN